MDGNFWRSTAGGVSLALSAGDAYAQERMEELLEFIVLMSALFEEFRNLSPRAMKGMVKLRGGIRKLLRG